MGMDVAAVESIARGIQGDAERLGQLSASIEALVGRLPSVWSGRDATSFVEEWRSRHRATLAAVQTSVQGLGQSALANAADQRAASAAASAPAAAGAHGADPEPSWWLNAGAQVHGAADLAVATSRAGAHDAFPVPRAFEVLGHVVGGLQVVTGTVDGVNAVQDGDWGRLAGDATDVALSGLGLAALAGGALAAPEVAAGLAAFGVAKGVIDATIPYSAQSLTQLLDYEAHRMFGVDQSAMTPAQATALAQRYSGPTGAFTMVGDKLNESTDEAVGAIGGVVSNGVDGIKSIWQWATGR